MDGTKKRKKMSTMPFSWVVTTGTVIITLLTITATFVVEAFSVSVSTLAPLSRSWQKSAVLTRRTVAITPLSAVHQFWGKSRSVDEVKGFVEDCLQQVMGEYGHGSGSSNTNSNINDKPADNMPVVDVVAAGESPLVVIHNFVSPSMCQDIIASAANSDNLKRSTTGESNKKSDCRTSSTVWLRDDDCQQPLRLIADMVSSISGLPPSCMENLQVCRYLPGQEFKLHTDHLDSFNDLDCGGRLATCLMYLSEPQSGGETWFPGLADEYEKDENASSNSKENSSSLSAVATATSTEPIIAPTQGSAVFFWNTIEKPGSPGYRPDMFLNVDVRLRHAGLPVIEGEKWICNRWVHPIPLDMGVRGVRPPCTVKKEEELLEPTVTNRYAMV
jgi:hypothetical protein